MKVNSHLTMSLTSLFCESLCIRKLLDIVVLLPFNRHNSCFLVELKVLCYIKEIASENRLSW